MPTISERLKKLDSVDDANLMIGYRFLVTPRRKTADTKPALKKAAAGKHKASDSPRKLASKSVHKAI
jgi:hypothetical protein